MINIIIAGDFCPHERVEKLLNNGKHETILHSIKPITTESDYCVVNLEAPIAYGSEEAIDKSGPNLGMTSNAINAIKDAGFKMVTLANNHFYDFGDEGVNNTINLLKQKNIDFVGGGRNIHEAQKYFIKEIKGKKVTFVNLCENEFSIATEKTGGSNPLDIVSNFYQIKEARENADYVIVIAHGGHEGYQLPSPRMKKTYRFFIDAGADVVINHHQHCFSGYEIYNNKPIFYGLGNFCFDWDGIRNDIWNEGYFVELEFNSKIDFHLHPYMQCNEEPIVKLHDTEEKEYFMTKIGNLNSIIIDDIKLNEAFNKFCHTHKNNYNMQLEPYTNRYIKALRSRHLIPSFISRRKKNLIINLFRCESHKDIMMNILNIK